MPFGRAFRADFNAPFDRSARQFEHLLAASRLRFDLDSILEKGGRKERKGGASREEISNVPLRHPLLILARSDARHRSLGRESTRDIDAI